MNKDYSNFTAVDFAEEPFFKEWINENKPEAAVFWTSFMANYPEKISAIEEAKCALALMSRLPERQVSVTMAGRAKDIKARIDQAVPSTILHSNRFLAEFILPESAVGPRLFVRRYFSAAAVFIVAIVSMVLLVLIRSGSDLSRAETQTIVQTTPAGKRTLINLPDNSSVWLNAESRLVYAKDFLDHDTREVFLTGEAFFDVAADKGKPFIVSTSSIIIKVLGTEFNVQSYDKDKTVETTVEEGKVAISVINGETSSEALQQTTILPNQRAVFVKRANKLILQNNVEATAFSDWRTGKLYFDNKPIMEVLAMIERWYGVTIHVDHAPPAQCTFSAKIETEQLGEVLAFFKASSGDSLDYEINGRDVYITGKLCE